MSPRPHVESEAALSSVADWPSEPLALDGFAPGQPARAQLLSGDRVSGEATWRVALPAGLHAPIGHFDADVELFVLRGALEQGGFRLRDRSYSFLPAGVVTGPWRATADTVLLFMPDAHARYVTADYAKLPATGETAVYHPRLQQHPRLTEYVPAIEADAMKWESTTFLPAGSARKSLRTQTGTGRATWLLGLVPRWHEGNFAAGHPTVEEAYCIEGDVLGHWSMADAPFARRYAAMRKDGYYHRPAHIPHGPFWSESGALLLFRTHDRLDCHFSLHNPDVAQRDAERLSEALTRRG